MFQFPRFRAVRFLVFICAGAAVLLSGRMARAELIAYYDFNDGAQPFKDSSGKNNHITGNAGTNPVWGAATGFQNSGAFDYSADRLIVPINVNSSAMPKMTWGAWVRTDTVASNLYKVLGQDNGAWDRVIGLDNRNPATFRYTTFTGDNAVSNTGPLEGTPTPTSTSAWAFIAASYDETAKTVTMYVDLDASSTADPLVTVTEPAGFGAGFTTFAIGSIRPDIQSESWDGAIDNVFVYDEVLSPAAVKALRDAGGIQQPPKITAFTAAPGHIDPGQSVTLSWTTSGANTLSINMGAPAISGNTGTVSVSPAATTTYTLTATNDQGTVTAQTSVDVGGVVLPPRMTEFMASNDGFLKDGDGNYSDWIELYNPNAFSLEFGGYSLKDSTTTWVLPNVQVPAGGYLLVFASGQAVPNYVDAGGFLHATFELSGDGETLQLLDKNGTTVLSEFTNVPAQHNDVSWGLESGTGTAGFMNPPTPRAVNGSALTGFVADTKFDVNRGFFTAPFTVTITSTTPGSSIAWTTDGSEPSPTHGTIAGPPAADQTPAAAVNVTTTTTLRARAFRAGWVSTGVDTQTYLFLEKVIDQPASPPGFPTTWGKFTGTNGSTAGVPVPADYEMKPAIVNANRPGMVNSLKSLPTMSIVGDPADLFGPEGILPNPFADLDGSGVYTRVPFVPERRVSVEWIQPDGAQEFQINCAASVMGGWSRHYEATPKKSIALTFQKDFGAGKLKFPLFGEGQVDEFDRINLRATFSDAWVDNAHPAQYLRDPFVRETYIAMGQPASHGTFVHLYLNGLYWGLYNPTERPDSSFAESHYGGKKEDYDALKHQSLIGPGNAPTDSYEAVSGTVARWQQALTITAGNMADNNVYNQLKQYVDMVSLADYIIVNSFLSNQDWPGKNWYAFGRRDGADGGFKFCPWDSEYSLLNVNANLVGATNNLTPARFYARSRDNAEFRLLFADRIHKHAFNNGPLTKAVMIARYTAMANHIDAAIDAEAARWGDNPNTRQGVRDYRKSNWIAARDQVLNTYFPSRPSVALGFYRTASPSMYPSIDAPEFSQHGGVIDPPLITFPAPGTGTIYYTTDGSDPRLVGGAVNPIATPLTGGSATESYFALEATGWRYFVTPTGLGDSDIADGNPPHASYDASNWKHPNFDDSAWATGQAMLGYGGITNRTVRTMVDYGLDPVNRYMTTYFRRTFTVPDASKVSKLLIDVIRDDGAIIYINGRNAGRTNMNAGNQRYQDPAIGDASPEDQVVRIEYVPPAGLLHNGSNVIAVELHQSSVSSSDMGIDVALQGQLSGSGISLTQSGTVKARLRSGTGEWSALTEAFFTVAADPATASNLVISKIHYHPAAPTPAEIAAGFTSDKDFEYIELMNIGTRTVSLAGLRFVDGIDFTFNSSAVAELTPGQRGVIVNNTAAFTLRYGAGVKILGQFTSGNLSNDGETLALVNTAGVDLWRFTYNDGGAWPDSPDGNGPALVLTNPNSPPSNAGMSLPDNWRPSSSAGGAPGSDDRISLAAWLAAQPDHNPLADPDGDGVNQLLAFATGARTTTPAQPFMPTMKIRNVDGVTDARVFEIRELIGATGFTSTVETSQTLQSWTPVAMRVVSVTDHGDGTMSRQFVPEAPLPAGSTFFHLSVKQAP